MSNDNKNNLFDLPRLNDEEKIELPKTNETQYINPSPFDNSDTIQNQSLPSNENNNENDKPIIEIPKEYYEKLEKERQDKEAAEKEHITLEQERKQAVSETNQIITLSIFNAIVIFIIMYLTVNKNLYFFIGIPVYIVILTIFYACKDKEKAPYPITIMLGGMIIAIATFIISMLRENEMDTWTYYTIAAVVLGLLGMITSNIITNIIHNAKNIKALQGIGYILYFIIIIGLPLYFANNSEYREEFYRLILNNQVEVEAEDENTFITKTLKQRYNVTFTCDETNITNEITVLHQRLTTRNCTDQNNNTITVKSIAYNEGLNQYIVEDNYLDILFLNDIRTNIINKVTSLTNASEVSVYLYPNSNCNFYGDCTDCDEYYEIYSEENDSDSLYERSSSFNFSKYLNQTTEEFLTNIEFKYIIKITGTYSNESEYSTIINNILDNLNSLGYKNTYGYIISLYNSNTTGGVETATLVYKVVGDTTNDQTFKEPEVVKSGNN